MSVQRCKSSDVKILFVHNHMIQNLCKFLFICGIVVLQTLHISIVETSIQIFPVGFVNWFNHYSKKAKVGKIIICSFWTINNKIPNKDKNTSNNIKRDSTHVLKHQIPRQKIILFGVWPFPVDHGFV